MVEESLYEWNVRLLQIDVESNLYKDLEKLKTMGQKGEIVLNITFGYNYPFEPPFVRVVEPIISS